MFVPVKKFLCGYCGQVKESSSGVINNRTRIRCECGGPKQDGKARMHSKWEVVSRQPEEVADQQKRRHLHRSMLKAVKQQPPSASQPAPPNCFFSKSSSKLPHTNRAVEQLELEPQRDGVSQQIGRMPQPLSQSQPMVGRSDQAFGERANHKGTDSDNSQETWNCDCPAASEARAGEGANAAQSGGKRTANEPEQAALSLTNNEQSSAKRLKLSDPPYVQALDWAQQTLMPVMAAFVPGAAATFTPLSSCSADASASATDSGSSTGLDVLAKVCENQSDSAFGVGNAVGQHNSGWVDEERASTPSSISSVGENLTSASLRRRTFESTSESANNPIAMINRLAADTTVIFAPEDGIFPKPYSRPECEAAFQAQHTKKRIFVILIPGLVLGIILLISGIGLEISRSVPGAARIAPVQMTFGCLFIFVAAALYIKRSKYQFRHYEISCLLCVFCLLFMIPTIGVQSFKCYHLRENNLLEAVRQGYINCGLATITVAGIAHLAAPRWLFIYPLLILIPLNTGYLSSPELLLCCIYTVLQSLCLAFTMQKEQRSNFEGQVTLHQAQLKQRQYNELKLELEKHESELSQAEVGQQIYSTQEPVQLIAECTSDGVIEDLENAPTDSEPLASADRVFEATSDSAKNPCN